MIGLDTNVLVRYVMQDDPKQSPKATRLVESLTADDPGFVSIVALIEFIWVLTSCYDLNRTQLVQAIDAVLRSKEFVVDRANQVMQALRLYRAGAADFADCVIERSGFGAGCAKSVTFDAAAARTAGMVSIG